MRLSVGTKLLCLITGVSVLVLSGSSPAAAQEGAFLYKTYCAVCHDVAQDAAPSREVLALLRPEGILRTLETGSMKRQANERSRNQRRILAEYLSGKPLGAEGENPIPRSAFCASSTGSTALPSTVSAWNGWGVTITNTRFQPTASAGITADDISRLKLKWAFGFPGASSGGTQPVVFEGRLYMGTAEGILYALDAQTGCMHWTLEVEASIRSAITIWRRPDGQLVAYFGDQSANMYAVDAESGKLLWKIKLDDNDRAAITAAAQLHDGRLYVSISSREESQLRIGDPKYYGCCRSRGSVVALDAVSGKQIWKSYMIDTEAVQTQKNRFGIQLWGPSGAGVWNTPTIDVKRNMLYVGTGNNYSPPATKTSDAIVAVDMRSGEIRWVNQLLENDIWNGSCRRADRDPAVCPDADAPDIDYSASPVLVDLKNGRQVLIAGSKGGKLLALDPDREGRTIWNIQAFEGGSGGGITWGVAVDDENVYAAGDGVKAFELSAGGIIWHAEAPACGDRKPCRSTNPGAVTAIPGVAFSGSLNGQLRAYSTRDGEIIWEHNTVQEYETVNGVPANGGSMSNAGPTVVGGMLYMSSGYSHHGGYLPGNVLLAFSAE